jgi:ESF2/ABP1 family protein
MSPLYIAHEHAERAARLRMELAQSKREQKHYLKQVEIGRSLEARKEKKRKREEEKGDQDTQHPSNRDLAPKAKIPRKEKDMLEEKDSHQHKKKSKGDDRTIRKKDVGSKGADRPSRSREGDLDAVLGSIF